MTIVAAHTFEDVSPSPFWPLMLAPPYGTEGWLSNSHGGRGTPSTGSSSNTSSPLFLHRGANEEGLQSFFVELCCHLPNSFDDLAHDWSPSTPNRHSVWSRTVEQHLCENIEQILLKLRSVESNLVICLQMNIIRFRNSVQSNKLCMIMRKAIY